MVKIGFLFPGQGAQMVGMGQEIYDSFACARAVFSQTSDILDIDLAQLCFNGPEEALTRTVNAQITIFTVSIAILSALKETYPHLNPHLNCGLSLGEYSALVSAGALDLATAIKIVYERGRLMEHAAQNNPGGMLSIIGLSEDVCRSIAKECAVDVANYNSPEQIVLSGAVDDIKRAEGAAVAAGAKKAVMLNVSGAFHSRLMQSAALKMKDVLSNVEFQKPSSGFIPNVTATMESNPDRIKENLILQVDHSVRWTQSIQSAMQEGVMHFLEIGPGKVLKGLARRINKETRVVSVETVSALKDVDEIAQLAKE